MVGANGDGSPLGKAKEYGLTAAILALAAAVGGLSGTIGSYLRESDLPRQIQEVTGELRDVRDGAARARNDLRVDADRQIIAMRDDLRREIERLEREVATKVPLELRRQMLEGLNATDSDLSRRVDRLENLVFGIDQWRQQPPERAR